MRKLITGVVILAAIATGAAYYAYHRPVPEPVVTTARVTQGDVVEAVGATGTLQAVTTVQVGSQVSGTISELNADFNSLVHRGEVLARLDPSLFQTQVEQARANLVRSQADVERLRVSLEDARTKLRRSQELTKRQLVPQTDLETAQVNVNSAEAQLKSSQAQVTQAQASLNQSQVNLEHTVITAPIDGIVVSRNVDVGQTVAASMQAPTLFILAADLTKMQVLASLDESDVGRIRPNQIVRFRVDAYPAEDFTGTVTQVRLQPQVQQNVVTYSTVIAVPNPELKLKPGMTANVTIEIARRSNVIRVPSAALRFRPTNEIYAALGQTPPEPVGPGRMATAGGDGQRSGDAGAASSAARQGAAGAEGGAPGAGRRPDAGVAGSAQAPRSGAPGQAGQRAVARAGGQGGASAAETLQGRSAAPERPGSSAPASPEASAGQAEPGARSGGPGGRSRGGAGGANGGGAGSAERTQNLSPEERTAMIQRMRDRGMSPPPADPPPGAATTPAVQAARAPRAQAQAESLTARNPQATTIDALFGPLPPVESSGRVWIFVNKQLKSVRVRLGISDGQVSELLEGEIEPNAELVTNVSTGEAVRSTGLGFGGMPMMGQPGRGGAGAGRPGGGGGGAPAGR